MFDLISRASKYACTLLKNYFNMIRCFYLLGLLLIANSVFAQKKEIIKTDKAPVPIAPYSQAVKANGFVYVAGQIGLEPVSRKLVEGGIEKETPQIMENIKAILAEAGLELKHIVNTTIYMKDLSNFEVVNKIYGSYFAGEYPARATVGVANLPGGANIEIAVVAVAKK